MNTIRGRVVVKESGVGIPNLLVVAFDQPKGAAAEPPGFESWKRLGSVLTKADGAFEIVHTPAARNDATALDVQVVVFAPDDVALDARARVLYLPPNVRRSAGANEELFVRIPASDLTRVGIPHPTTPGEDAEEPATIVARLRASAERDANLVDGTRATHAFDVERVRKEKAAFHAELHGSIRDKLSAVPARLASAETLVRTGESVEAKNAATIVRGIRDFINPGGTRKRAVMRRHVALSAAQLEALRGQLAPDGTITADALTELLGPSEVPRPREIDPCRIPSAEERACAATLGVPVHPAPPAPPPPPTPPSDDQPGDGVEATPDRVRHFVARLVETMTTPEERVATNLEPRADRIQLQANVRDLSLSPSPADAPSFRDFYSLNIAFEDVWQEVVDEGLVSLAEELHADTLALGGDPRAPSADPTSDAFQRLSTEARLAVRSQTRARRNVRDHRGEPSTPRPQVRDHRGEAPPPPRVPVRDHRDPRPADPYDRIPELLKELEQRLREPYSFTIFAANRKERSVNFGILVNYRQIWTPEAYQAGKLAKTVTLAPKETRKYSKKVVVNKKRSEKEARIQSRQVKEESQITSRAEQEIFRKATATTNFSHVAQQTMSVGIGEAGGSGSATNTTTFSRNASRESSEMKKAFHEAVFKAAQEFKDELTTNVETETSTEEETIDSGEITNPNDEIAVTFLFYELQRRYRVSEKLYKVTPVVLVAQEVPRPDEIDEAWVLAHDWIFRKVLLDDTFRPALDYLSKNIAGDEVALGELAKNVAQQRTIVDALKQEITVVRDRIAAQRNLLEGSIFGAGLKKKEGRSSFRIPIVGGIFETIADTAADVARELGEFLHAPSSGEHRGNPLEDAIQRSLEEERELLMRLERESTALNAVTERYAKLLSDHRNRQTEVARLLVHIKANILHYMQAIWSFEPADQRYFRLHKVRVPSFKPERTTVRFPSLVPQPDSMARLAHRTLGIEVPEPTDLYMSEVVTEIDPNLDFVDLASVADLDSLLGYKGNYMIFPLHESNPVTDLQMAPYVVAGWNEIVDPDDIGNWTLEDFVRYVNCLKETLPAEQFTSVQDQLRAQYKRLLSEPRREGEILSLPTDSLFIEALPASQTLMEEFKRKHRGVDVKRAQAEVRRIELENLRYAMRVLKDELDDPDVEKKVVVNGSSSVVVPPES